MIRGATRGAFRSAREILRASKRKTGSRRSVNMMMHEEGSLGGQQRHAFGRATNDTIARALSVTAFGLLDRNVVDALNMVMAELIAEDDDGR